MMEKQNSDELDLYDLLVKVVRFIRRNGWLMLAFSIAGMVASFFIKPEMPSFSGKMLVTSSVINVSTGNGILMPLNSLIDNRAVDSLAAKLTITHDEAAALHHIGTEGIRSEMMSPFDSIYNIVTDVSNPGVIPAVQKGVLHYLSENKFIKTRAAIRRKTTAAMVRGIGIQLRSMDSVKARIIHPNSALSTGDPGTLYLNYVRLFKKQLDLQNQLDHSAEIEVIYAPISIAKPTVSKTGLQLAFGFAAGLAVALLLIFLRFIYPLGKTPA